TAPRSRTSRFPTWPRRSTRGARSAARSSIRASGGRSAATPRARRSAWRALRPDRAEVRLRGVYPWPLEPFDRAHPVRGYFNDPRISGSSRAFHFGIDIAAPNGTPVFAVAGVTGHLENPRAVSVAAAGVEFGYWHIVPAVTHLQRVS